MAAQLYVFETTLPNGTCVLGSAGLPYRDMVNLETFYTDSVTCIVPATVRVARLKIVTPLSKKIPNTN